MAIGSQLCEFQPFIPAGFCKSGVKGPVVQTLSKVSSLQPPIGTTFRTGFSDTKSDATCEHPEEASISWRAWEANRESNRLPTLVVAICHRKQDQSRRIYARRTDFGGSDLLPWALPIVWALPDFIRSVVRLSRFVCGFELINPTTNRPKPTTRQRPARASG